VTRGRPRVRAKKETRREEDTRKYTVGRGAGQSLLEEWCQKVKNWKEDKISDGKFRDKDSISRGKLRKASKKKKTGKLPPPWIAGKLEYNTWVTLLRLRMLVLGIFRRRGAKRCKKKNAAKGGVVKKSVHHERVENLF